MAKLYFRHGTMGSAKTLNLLAVAHNYRAQGKRVVVLKPKLDDRFGAREVASRHITVNVVAPGLIETEMTKTAEFEEILRLVPARRLGQVEEVASLVAYLLSDAAGYITRQVICIDGGLS